MKKINIIQFMPYFPHHKGGVETVGEEIGKYWVKSNFGIFINLVTDFEQDKLLNINEKIVFRGKIIGYKKDGYEVLVCPSIEIINNFPIYKFWDKKYGIIMQYLKEKIGKDKEEFRVITHTRFFLTSFIGGIFARKNKIKWVHIEHGSSYVKLSSKLKSYLSILYDKSFGKWIFRKADRVVGVSKACKMFIRSEFVERDVEVIYRGVDLQEKKEINELSKKFKDKIIVGFVGRLFKWKNVDSLIKAYYNLDEKLKNKIQIVIVGEGEDFDRLNLLDSKKQVYFTGGKSFNDAIELQSQFDIHFHTSSPGGGLATTLLQAMNLGCFIVSTPYEGADEVIEDGKNGVLLKNDTVEELKRGLEEGVSLINRKEEFASVNKNIFDESFVWSKNIGVYYNFFR